MDVLPDNVSFDVAAKVHDIADALRAWKTADLEPGATVVYTAATGTIGVAVIRLARGAGGVIVAMSSQIGSVGYPGRVAYCATKHAVDSITRALAVEWAREGIRVNAVAPTFVETP